MAQWGSSAVFFLGETSEGFQQSTNHCIPRPTCFLSSGFKEVSIISSSKLEVSPLGENRWMFVYLLGGKMEKYQPKDIFVFILYCAWRLCSNWKLAIWQEIRRWSHTQRNSLLANRYFFAAKSFLLTTKLSDFRIFIHPAVAAWSVT